VEELLERYGLLAVFTGAYLEGDATVILSGVVSHMGLVHYGAAVAVAFVAGMLRDATCYTLGRSSSRARRSRAYEKAAGAVERLAGRFGPLEIVAAPFLYGARTASMIFWGVRDLPAARFLALDAIGCGAWVLAFSALGYLVSNRAEAVLGEVKEAEKWLLGALLAIGVFLLLRRAVARPRV
jgi:membrane protein DedA with SNARE-associated domain